MKQFFIFVVFVLFCGISQAQVINASLMHDGIERAYILYVPTSYDGEKEVPLVFNFHGFGSNAGQQLFYSAFVPLADEHEFILCFPEGTVGNDFVQPELQGQTHFNVGGFTTGSTVDDVGFTNKMLDIIIAEYEINQDRVYSTGMSNGGFMSFLLACQLSDRIAAVASVTGSMTPETSMDCAPSHDMPIMQIHGTTDATVPYEGDPLWTNAIVDVMTYWNTFNGCDQEESVANLEDVNTNDGSTVEHFTYANCNNPDIVNEHYKITGGGHTWPGASFPIPDTNLDFSATDEIWRFFSQYDINGKIETVSSVSELEQDQISIFPNPIVDVIQVEMSGMASDYTLQNLTGSRLAVGVISQEQNTINVADLRSGVYVLTIGEKALKVIKL